MISEPESPPTSTSWRAVAAGATIGFCALTWFLISVFAMHSSIGDAAGEALGVALGFLVLFSIIGAVRNSRHP